MSSTITGTGNNYPTNVTIPSDGDARSVASVNVPFQALADRTQYLYEGKAGRLPLEMGYPLDNTASRWTWQTDAAALHWEQTDVTSAGRLQWWWRMPIIQVGSSDWIVTSCRFDIDGSGGSAGANAHLAGGVPATMPKFTLYSRKGGTITTLGTATDASAQPTYDSNHPLTLSGLTQILEWDRIFLVSFEGEAGANSVASALTIYDATLVLERS